MFKLKLNKINIKLYKINISVEAALETILQSVTLAICDVSLLITMQRYAFFLRRPNFFS